MKRSGESRPEPGECRLERVARQRIGVFTRRDSAAQAGHGGAENGGDENPKDGMWLGAGREKPGIDGSLNAGGQLCLTLANKLESLPVARNLGDRTVQKHQREIFRMCLTEI